MSPHEPDRPESAASPADAVPPIPPSPTHGEEFTSTPANDRWLDSPPADLDQPTIRSLPVPASAGPPHPGFGFALLWCLAFVFVTYSVVIGTAIVVFTIQAALSGDVDAYMRTALKVEQPPPGGAPPKAEMTKQLADAIGPGLFLAELTSVLFALVVIRVVVGRDWKRQLALGLPSPTALVLALLSLPAFLILPSGIHELAKRFIPSFMGDNMEAMGQLFAMWPLWFGILTLGVGPGLGEELWCRGFLGRGLMARHGLVVGVVLTSVLFGLLHLDPAYAVVTGCMGLWLHYLYLTSRSLWTSILLHTANNSMAVLAAHSTSLGVLDRGPDQIPLPLYGASLVLLAAIAWALYRCRPVLASAGIAPEKGWEPEYPGVAYPPPGSGSTLVRRLWPGWLASLLVVAALAIFSLVLYLVEAGRLGG